MANYTMCVYDILEQKELYPHGIFPSDYPFYTNDVNIKKEFEDLFIAHYMTSEIGFETVYRWQQAFKAKMMLITPMMKQRWDLYQEWEKDLDYLYDTNDYTDTRTIDTTDNGTSNTKTNDSGSSNSSSNDSGTSSSTNSNEGTSNTTSSNSGNSNTINKGSDTNNGVAIINASEGALTSESTSDVTTSDSGTNKTTNSNSGSSNVTSSNESESNNNYSNEGTSNTTSSNTGRTEEVFNHSEKRTSLMYPSADLVEKRRALLFDLNREIINQTRDLFMCIY